MNILEFKSLLVKKCVIDLEIPVLMGFSGGPDSVCLLSLLINSGSKVIAAHLDHSLRPGSAAEAAHAEEVCDHLCVPFISQRVDVQKFAREMRLSVEEAARLKRYEFLFSEAEKAGAQAVMTGHHADDQIETVLMHFLRGSALSGLAGMRMVLLPNPWSDVIPLVRPLLHYTREEIETYLSGIPIETLADESNQDTGYFRNRIRKELIPLLRSYNPQVKERVLRMTEVIALEDELVSKLTRRAWVETIYEEGEGYLVFDRRKAASLDPALLRRLVRKAISTMDNTLRDIDYKAIEKGCHFMLEPTGSNRVDLLGGIEMFLYQKDRVVFARLEDPLHALWPQMVQENPVVLDIPGSIRISELWQLNSSHENAYQVGSDPFICQLDSSLLSEPLTLGLFNEGDRFMPYGAGAVSMKLGDFWTNQGLAVRARRRWPIVRSGNEIVWVPGFRIANRFKVGQGTDKIIRLEVIKN
ncbi:MAG TPA: tRNA lysidine(34) synthetase TilS [Anaerolineaceae bacterium]|nr:tRNA lysidine(34) synthetase TilS [Anaerolineaceae bacterium]